ncbi:hypothetical protein BpHYR1_013482 [Brachionus plicatilis]|uniref:Uncharacterized protein n=1 Tax=Brachionus plicatilis TaxID=10195 RepID=A0A3M7PIG5_BRAPC|nr:hypothetical protein BpHYR1_013482 [Brachionus plicatilis]
MKQGDIFSCEANHASPYQSIVPYSASCEFKVNFFDHDVPSSVSTTWLEPRGAGHSEIAVARHASS